MVTVKYMNRNSCKNVTETQNFVFRVELIVEVKINDYKCLHNRINTKEYVSLKNRGKNKLCLEA